MPHRAYVVQFWCHELRPIMDIKDMGRPGKEIPQKWLDLIIDIERKMGRTYLQMKIIRTLTQTPS